MAFSRILGMSLGISTTIWLSVTASMAQSPSPAELLPQARQLNRAKKWSEAVPIWQQIVQENPTRGDFWSELAQALYESKNYRPAIAAHTKAYELRAGYPNSTAYDIACCYALLGEHAPALKWLEVAINGGLRDLEHVRKDDDLKPLRDDPKFRELAGVFDVSKMSRDEGWRCDLKFLAREIKRLHYDPYRRNTREQFDNCVRDLDREIPKLTDPQVICGLLRLACMAGDGHTSLRPGKEAALLPIQLFHFQEGVFVTAAAPSFVDLAGAQILKIGDTPIADALKRIEPYIAHDNAMSIRAGAATRLTSTLLLNGIGLSASPEQATLTIRDAQGKERTVTLKAEKVSMQSERVTDEWRTARHDATNATPLYLKNRKQHYWFEYLAEPKVVYCQYNSVRNQDDEPFEKFCERLFKFINDNDVERLVLDLRWNGGGNTFLTKPLIHGLIRSTKINQPGKLFVIIGRNTFSAAQNCTTDIEMHTSATFVGEPTGSSPNFIGETVRFELPYSKLTGSISDLYWGRSWPMDYRTWIAPQIYAPPTIAMYKANRDPAMEAIQAYRGPKPTSAQNQ